MESLEVLPCGRLLPRHKQGQRQPHPGKQVVVCTEGYGGGLYPTTPRQSDTHQREHQPRDLGWVLTGPRTEPGSRRGGGFVSQVSDQRGQSQEHRPPS